MLSKIPPIALILTALTFKTAAVEIRIDSTQHFQTLTGLGAMLYPYGGRYTDPGFPELMIRDFGASLIRMEVVPNAQESEPTNLTTYLTDPLDKIIAGMDFKNNENSRAGEVARALYGARLDEVRFIATVWSPPKWMKTNGDVNHGGKLRPDRRAHFARYLAAYCRGFEKVYGVPIYSLSIQNELMFEEPYKSCLYDPKTTEWGEAISAVATEFDHDRLATTLFGPENMGLPDWFLGNNCLFAAQVIGNPTALRRLQAWAFHGYEPDGKTVASSKKNWQAYNREFRRAGKELWMTETSGNDPSWIHATTNGAPDGALAMGIAMHDALVAGGVNAWVYWSFQDGDHVSPYNLIAHGDTSSKKYNTAKHFTRYLRPGAVRVAATPDTDDFAVVAFVHERKKSLAVVLVNLRDHPEEVKLALPRESAITRCNVYATTATENFSPQSGVELRDGTAAFVVPAQSIATFYGVAGK